MKTILLTAAASARLAGVTPTCIADWAGKGLLTPAQDGIWKFGPLELVVPTLFRAEDVIACKKERERT